MTRLTYILLAILLTACTVTVRVDPISGTVPVSPAPLPVDNLGIPYRVAEGSTVANFTFANERDPDGRFILDMTTDSVADEGTLSFQAYNAAGDTIANWSTLNVPNVDWLRFRLGTDTAVDDIAVYVIGVD